MLDPGIEAPQQMTDDNMLNHSTGLHRYRVEMIAEFYFMYLVF